MIDFEDRLSVPPRRRSAWTRPWLVLVAAAAAVVVIIAVVVVVSGLMAGESAPSGATAPMTAAAATGLPRHYVVAFQRYGADGRTIATYAVVHETATGAALASVRVPTLMTQGGIPGPTISAAADDRTFVLTESGQAGIHHLAWFFLLRVAADGRSAKLTKLPLSTPSSMPIDSAALSPDGTRLAMTAQWSCGATRCAEAGVRVVNLATESVTSWTTEANGTAFSVSWVGNHKLAFEWQTSLSNPPAGQHTGYRLIAVSDVGGNLLAGRVIASPAVEQTGYEPAALVTSDSKDVVTSEARNVHTWTGRFDVVLKIVEMSASTGRTVRVLYTTTVDHATGGSSGEADSLDQECRVLSLGTSVTSLLVDCFSIGVLAHGKLLTLPGFPSAASSGISGQDAIAW